MRVISVTILVGLLLLFQNCGGTQGAIAVSGGLQSNYGGPAVATSTTNTLNNLQGQWDLACTSAGAGYLSMQLSVTGSSFTLTKNTFLESTCTTLQQKELLSGLFTIPNAEALSAPASATALNALILTDTLTPVTITAVNQLNATNVCSFRGWALNSGHACAANVGQTILGNFNYSGFSLQLGLGLSSVVMGSAGLGSSRLTVFDAGYWFASL